MRSFAILLACLVMGNAAAQTTMKTFGTGISSGRVNSSEMVLLDYQLSGAGKVGLENTTVLGAARASAALCGGKNAGLLQLFTISCANFDASPCGNCYSARERALKRRYMWVKHRYSPSFKAFRDRSVLGCNVAVGHDDSFLGDGLGPTD